MKIAKKYAVKIQYEKGENRIFISIKGENK